MFPQKRTTGIHRGYYLLVLLFISENIYASYIETTIGAAVVNDATAAYYNPAALVLLKNTQLIPLGSAARFRTQFNGSSTAVATNTTETGTSSSTTHFYSPSFYVGLPANERITTGFAALTNYANRDPESNSILRYVQSSNQVQDYDFVPAVGVKINDYLALGGSVNFSYTSFDLHPITGFPGSNIADSQGHNQTDGSGVGMSLGCLLQPRPSTLIGLHYKSVTSYNQSGSSEAGNTTTITSNNYHYKLRTPARMTLTISQEIAPTLRLITTINRTQWNITRNVHVYNAVAIIGTTPTIVSGTIPYYLHNTWTLTFGGQYQFLPKWILRLAATYNQTPDSGFYQVGHGDTYILGGSLGYDFNKIVRVDGSYAHAFVQNQTVNINGNRFIISGTNSGSRDVVSLKVTVNVV